MGPADRKAWTRAMLQAHGGLPTPVYVKPSLSPEPEVKPKETVGSKIWKALNYKIW